MLTSMRRAGCVASTAGPELASPLGGEDAAPADHGAGELRGCLDEHERLVLEWCALAVKGGWRVPDALLPDVLEFVAKSPQTRTGVLPALGEKGRWLAGLNPQWSIPAAAISHSTDSAGTTWGEGTLAERKALLTTLARQDPELARELVQSTWKEDPAKARSEFLSILAESPRPEDEAFLTGCLSDRSMDVRYVATLGLGKLPASVVIDELVQLANEFVQLAPKVDVRVPEMDDTRLDRFGIPSAKGAARIQQRQSRLTRLVALIPPSRWQLDREVRDRALAALLKNENGEIVFNALSLAAQAYRDPEWAVAFVEHQVMGSLYVMPDLVELLDRDQQEEIALRVLNAKGKSRPWQLGPVAVTAKPWSASFTRIFFETMPSAFDKKGPHIYPGYVTDAALFAHPLTAQVPDVEVPPEWQSTFDTWRRVLDLRRSMHQKLAPRSPQP
jgi:hypothetical protein